MASSKPKYLKPGEKAVVKLTVEQVDLIVERTFIDEHILASKHAAKVWDGVLTIRCTLDQLEELAGCAAAEANNTKDRNLRRRLDAISDEIDRANLTYADGTPPNRAALHLVTVKESQPAPPPSPSSLDFKATKLAGDTNSHKKVINRDCD